MKHDTLDKGFKEKIFKIPTWIGRLFNKLPQSLRETDYLVYYFSNGRLSCINYKWFDGWFECDFYEMKKLIKYQWHKLRGRNQVDF